MDTTRDWHKNDYVYEKLCLPKRQGKPRTIGLTGLLDSETDLMGWNGLRACEDFLIVAGEYLDYAKIQTHHILSLPHDYLKEKIALYNRYNVTPMAGGIPFEIAHLQNAMDELLLHYQRLGIKSMEISENYITLTKKERNEYFKFFKDEGFYLIYEYGRREVDKAMELNQLEDMISECSEYNIDHVILEEEEVTVLERDAPQRLEEIKHKEWFSKLFFEADPWNFPKQHVHLLKTFGNDVNLSNVAPGHLLRLEDCRLGMARPVNFYTVQEMLKNNKITN